RGYVMPPTKRKTRDVRIRKARNKIPGTDEAIRSSAVNSFSVVSANESRSLAECPYMSTRRSSLPILWSQTARLRTYAMTQAATRKSLYCTPSSWEKNSARMENGSAREKTITESENPSKDCLTAAYKLSLRD